MPKLGTSQCSPIFVVLCVLCVRRHDYSSSASSSSFSGDSKVVQETKCNYWLDQLVLHPCSNISRWWNHLKAKDAGCGVGEEGGAELVGSGGDDGGGGGDAANRAFFYELPMLSVLII
jgi:hypothetical protein